ncbi:hypothetical protein BDP81DRAFT_112736 [Colletotrichum phormii]|uniref:Uncharacterized protein n=1 Tax=Colletotrichum phormii TaxID=359342 RepID=A0AAJ0EAR9_9PEZI|nr:uncharacterized protein BDP81DRAFT_112736 [Colletotrichum phormii]KAK1624240.1 hypothetical protein BDP81DRAFT_112736 [Colletotrichum phormii]
MGRDHGLILDSSSFCLEPSDPFPDFTHILSPASCRRPGFDSFLNRLERDHPVCFLLPMAFSISFTSFSIIHIYPVPDIREQNSVFFESILYSWSAPTTPYPTSTLPSILQFPPDRPGTNPSAIHPPPLLDQSPPLPPPLPLFSEICKSRPS